MKHFKFNNIEGDHFVNSIHLFDGMPYRIPKDPNIEDFVGVASEMGYIAAKPIAWVIREEYYSWRKEAGRCAAADRGKINIREISEAA